MKYILIIFITLLISGSVSAASSAATVTSGAAEVTATVNGLTISSTSQANRTDADTFAFGGGTATSQASNGTTKITSENGLNTFSSTDTVNLPLPINQSTVTPSNTAKKVIKPQLKQIAASQKNIESKPAVEAQKTEDKKIVVTPPINNESRETVDNVNQRLKTLNQLVGSTIVILVIILLNQLVLTYLLHKIFRQDITLKVPGSLS